MITVSSLANLDGVRHAFFTRRGGVSEGIYKSLNCGPGSDDNQEHIYENRARVMEKLGLPAPALVTLYQTHSTNVVEVNEPWSAEAAPKADAMVSKTPGIALGILTADCTPVLFADEEAGIIGAAHAGWRGAFDGVLEATVMAMVELGAKQNAIKVGVGPCIHQESYEVGPEFFSNYLNQEDGNERYFIPSTKFGHYMFDHPGYVAARLGKLGLAEVETVGQDTYSDEELFYSYRRVTHRGEGDYGRLLSVITHGVS